MDPIRMTLECVDDCREFGFILKLTGTASEPGEIEVWSDGAACPAFKSKDIRDVWLWLEGYGAKAREVAR